MLLVMRYTDITRYLFYLDTASICFWSPFSVLSPGLFLEIFSLVTHFLLYLVVWQSYVDVWRKRAKSLRLHEQAGVIHCPAEAETFWHPHHRCCDLHVPVCPAHWQTTLVPGITNSSPKSPGNLWCFPVIGGEHGYF